MLINFVKVAMKTKSTQVPENNNSSDNKSDREVSDFSLVKILVMNGYLKITKQNLLFNSRHQEVICKNKCSVKRCSGM